MILSEESLEVWEPGSVAPKCVFAGGRLTLFLCLFLSAAAGTGKKRGLRNTKVQILTYIFVLCVFFCVFLSTFALIKRRESHHHHNPVTVSLRSPGAAGEQTPLQGPQPPWGHSPRCPSTPGALVLV